MKTSKMTGILAKARHYLPLKTLQMLTLYMTMIYPYLTYCNITWSSTYPTRLNPILKTQKNLWEFWLFQDTQKNQDQYLSPWN